MVSLFKTPYEDIERLAEQISANWTKATASIIEVAKLCSDANKQLDKSEKKELFALLPFSQSTFSKQKSFRQIFQSFIGLGSLRTKNWMRLLMRG